MSTDSGGRLEAPTSRHVAQFYESEEFLIDAVDRFVRGGLEAGDGIMLVATRPHLDALASRLDTTTTMRDAVATGRAVLLDADDTLAQILVDGVPDPGRFRRVVAQGVERCVRGCGAPRGVRLPRVRAFGEMVDVLCRDGRHQAAVRLEELWNQAADVHALSIFCGYAMSGFTSAEGTARFGEVCDQHDMVLPADVSGSLRDVATFAREIARLQQQVHALRSEARTLAETTASLRVALERAEHTSRVRDNLLAAVAQELRRPLKTIVSWSSLLRSAQPVDTLEAAEAIELGAHAQYQLLEDLADASRVVGGTMRLRRGPVDLAFVLRAAVEAVSHAAISKDITIEVSIESDPCLAHADAHRMEQVFSNLLSNAIQFTDDGGRVGASLARRDDWIDFAVHDDGRGISEAALPHVFDRLRVVGATAGPRPDGMQLGLAVARHLVELHGGSIGAQSEGVGRGSTFTVRLPRRAAA
ncbi:MAG TPA: ATP-binding protein [Polyangiaceae bacterium]|nr:ATP-binding protein [Polyangiaceae bacterium]